MIDRDTLGLLIIFMISTSSQILQIVCCEWVCNMYEFVYLYSYVREIAKMASSIKLYFLWNCCFYWFIFVYDHPAKYRGAISQIDIQFNNAQKMKHKK